MLNFRSLARMFVRRGYKWNFKDGTRRIPTEKEINGAVMDAVDRLMDEPNLAQLEVGRLIVQKHDQRYDVYVHVGEVSR